MAAVFKGNDYLPLKFASVSFYCQVSDTGSVIDASYQASVHLVEGFQRRRLKCEKLTDDRRRTPSDGKSSLCLWQGELKIHVNIM
jgi:hypothetical protein